MELPRFQWHRLAAAVGIGLGLEVLERIWVVIFIPRGRPGRIGVLPLQPASYLVTLLAKAEHPGFEGQVGYFLFAVVLQWLIYSGGVYLLLAIARKKRDAVSGR